MLDRTLSLSPHFRLGELIPASWDEAVPQAVLDNLSALCLGLGEPIHLACGAVCVNDAWRPPALNVAVGGVHDSDHLTGRAMDFHIAPTDGGAWEAATLAAARFIRDGLRGRFGQLILEDHRVWAKKPGSLWVHVSLPDDKHPGTGGDPNALLFSTAPNEYEPLSSGLA